MPTANSVDCPACGAEGLALLPHPLDPARLVARHACLGLPARDVYETDALPAEPAIAAETPKKKTRGPVAPEKE